MSALFELRLVDTEDDVTIVFIALEPLDRPAASPADAAKHSLKSNFFFLKVFQLPFKGGCR